MIRWAAGLRAWLWRCRSSSEAWQSRRPTEAWSTCCGRFSSLPILSCTRSNSKRSSSSRTTTKTPSATKTTWVTSWAKSTWQRTLESCQWVASRLTTNRNTLQSITQQLVLWEVEMLTVIMRSQSITKRPIIRWWTSDSTLRRRSKRLSARRKRLQSAKLSLSRDRGENGRWKIPNQKSIAVDESHLFSFLFSMFLS